MKWRSSEEARLRALRALAKEASDQPTPDVDWDRVENRLFAEISKTNGANTHGSPAAVLPMPTAPVAGKRAWRVAPWSAAFAAVAAGFVIYGVIASRDARDTVAAMDERTTPAKVAPGGDALQVGVVAEADAHPVSFEKPGIVSFTLHPESRVRVVDVDESGEVPGAITVALLRGSVHAEVTPRPNGEAFAVEIENTRVAVHGTSFTVTREADRIVVDVAHGSVAVGPTGHRGATQGWLVVGPDRAAFSLDGAKRAEWLGSAHPGQAAADAKGPALVEARPSRTKRSAPGAVHAAPVHAAPGTDESSGAPEEPAVATPSPAEQERIALHSILAQIQVCYEQQRTALGVRFSVESSLRLDVSPEGVVERGTFAPPLSPTLMQCAQRAIDTVRFSAGAESRHLDVPLRLAPPAEK